MDALCVWIVPDMSPNLPIHRSKREPFQDTASGALSVPLGSTCVLSWLSSAESPTARESHSGTVEKETRDGWGLSGPVEAPQLEGLPQIPQTLSFLTCDGLHPAVYVLSLRAQVSFGATHGTGVSMPAFVEFRATFQYSCQGTPGLCLPSINYHRACIWGNRRAC